jgi:hypothetical protein
MAKIFNDLNFIIWLNLEISLLIGKTIISKNNLELEEIYDSVVDWVYL